MLEQGRTECSIEERGSQPLRELVLELVQACPLMCTHCSSNSTPYATTALPPSIILGVLRESVALGLERLALGGGEPTTADTFWIAIEEARGFGLRLKTYTSGVRFGRDTQVPIPFSEDFVNRLADVPELVVVFSVYAASPSIHDAITGCSGSLGILRNSLLSCLERGVETEFHFVPMRLNFYELPGVVALAQRHAVRRVSILRFVPQGRGACSRERLDLSSSQNKELARVIAACRASVPEVTIRTGSPFNDLLPGNNVACRLGVDKLIVQPNGDVVPCEAFKRYPLSQWRTNVHTMSVSAIWAAFNKQWSVQPSLTENERPFACPAQQLLRRSIPSSPITVVAPSKGA